MKQGQGGRRFDPRWRSIQPLTTDRPGRGWGVREPDWDDGDYADAPPAVDVGLGHARPGANGTMVPGPIAEKNATQAEPVGAGLRDTGAGEAGAGEADGATSYSGSHHGVRFGGRPTVAAVSATEAGSPADESSAHLIIGRVAADASPVPDAASNDTLPDDAGSVADIDERAGDIPRIGRAVPPRPVTPGGQTRVGSRAHLRVVSRETPESGPAHEMRRGFANAVARRATDPNAIRDGSRTADGGVSRETGPSDAASSYLPPLKRGKV